MVEIVIVEGWYSLGVCTLIDCLLIKFIDSFNKKKKKCYIDSHLSSCIYAITVSAHNGHDNPFSAIAFFAITVSAITVYVHSC